MCGAITFRAKGVGPKISACHCDMCCRWSSGPFFAVPCEALQIDDEEALGVITSSDWAERGFCTRCGSGLFYRITAEGPHHGTVTVALGTLEDRSGFTLAREWYIDKRPEAYVLEGERECFTQAQVEQMFGGA